MVKQNFLTKMLLLCALIVGSVSSAWAEDPNWSYTVVNGDASKLNTTTKTFTVDQTHVWSYEGTTVAEAVAAGVTPTITIGSYSSTYGIKFGESSSKYYKPVILSTTAFNDKAVKKVSLYLKHNGKKVGTLTVKQGETTIGSATTSNSNDWITVTCSETNEGAGGKLEIKYEVDQALYINKIEVWYDELSSGTATTTTINASGITNTDVYTGTAAGSLSATVSAGGNPISGATVTWSSSDTGVATIDANGAVTLVAAGTVTFTASYAGVSGTYQPSSATYKMTVTNSDPNVPGTLNNPYTVAQAIDATPSSGTSENVYIKGIVSKFQNTSIVGDGSNYRYYISDDGTTTNQLLVYKGKGLDNVAFSNADDLLVGDEVVIYGGLTTYNNIKEIAENNYIVSLNRKELVSIALSGDYTTTFVEGSEFSHEGVVVTATYNDQTTENVTTKATFSVPDMTQIGEQTITVTYKEKTASYTITITEKPSHTVTFSINGTETTPVDVKEGAAIDFPEVTAPEGYTFLGWTTAEISGEQASAPTDLLNEATMGTDDITYYAVFAIASGTPATLTKMESTDTFADGDNIVIVAYDEGAEKYYALYQETQNTSWVGKYEFDNNANTIAADDKNWLTVTASDNNWKLGDLTNGYLYSTGSNNLILDTENSSAFSLGYSEGNGFTLKYGKRWLSLRNDAGTNKFRLGGDGSAPIGVAYFDIYKFVSGSFAYSNYCTTIATSVPVTVSQYKWATFSSDKALDFTNSAVKAYIVTGFVEGTATITKEQVYVVPANTGLLLNAEEGTYGIPVATEEADDVSENKLNAVLGGNQTVVSEGTGSDVNYVLSVKSGKVVFAWIGETTATVKAGQAYLTLENGPKPDSGNAPWLSIEGDDETTGIQSIERTMNDNQYYTLDGRRVAEPTKGLYIVNGKKVVIK